jgi:uncharacterized membrane protein YfcA
MLDGQRLLIAFVLLMLVVAALMLRERKSRRYRSDSQPQQHSDACRLRPLLGRVIRLFFG